MVQHAQRKPRVSWSHNVHSSARPFLLPGGGRVCGAAPPTTSLLGQQHTSRQAARNARRPFLAHRLTCPPPPTHTTSHTHTPHTPLPPHPPTHPPRFKGTYEGAVIAHYITRSFQDYERKVRPCAAAGPLPSLSACRCRACCCQVSRAASADPPPLPLQNRWHGPAATETASAR